MCYSDIANFLSLLGSCSRDPVKVCAAFFIGSFISLLLLIRRNSLCNLDINPLIDTWFVTIIFPSDKLLFYFVVYFLCYVEDFYFDVVALCIFVFAAWLLMSNLKRIIEKNSVMKLFSYVLF